VSLIRLDLTSDVAPYEQVRSQIAALAASHELAAGQKLPTVRQLAADLGLAANTVARAYRELESDGVISTQGRRGTFIRSTILEAPEGTTHHRDAHDAAAALAATARRLGLTLPEATRLVEGAWSQSSNSG
jgi:DNA-binding transcriptional regulator YhcF (GntR family)